MSEMNPTHKELLESYVALPERLATAASGLGEDQLNFTGGAGEWSIRQIVHHLADGQTMWSVCMRMAIGAPGSAIQFDWYPGNEAWSERMAFAQRSLESSLTLLGGFHRETAELLTLIPEAWEREVIIGVAGSGDERAFGVAQIIDFTSEHFVEHLDEIASIRENIAPTAFA